MSHKLSPREEWLRSKVGQIVYRPDTGCTCEVCKHVYLNGLMVEDEYHADYLAEMECCYSRDGWPMQYFDNKAEAIEFEKNNPPKNNQL